VQEVDCKRVLAEPEQVFARQETLRGIREVDSECDEDESDGGVETVCLGASREDPSGPL